MGHRGDRLMKVVMKWYFLPGINRVNVKIRKELTLLNWSKQIMMPTTTSKQLLSSPKSTSKSLKFNVSGLWLIIKLEGPPTLPIHPKLQNILATMVIKCNFLSSFSEHWHFTLPFMFKLFRKVSVNCEWLKGVESRQ